MLPNVGHPCHSLTSKLPKASLGLRPMSWFQKALGARSAWGGSWRVVCGVSERAAFPGALPRQPDLAGPGGLRARGSFCRLPFGFPSTKGSLEWEPSTRTDQRGGFAKMDARWMPCLYQRALRLSQ